MSFFDKKISKEFDSASNSLASLSLDGATDDFYRIIANIDGDKAIIKGNGENVIRGTNKSDTIFADSTVFDDVGGDDIVHARGGDDLVYTFGGDDEVHGGRGDDTIQTADGDDFVSADRGDDDVQSGRGRDIVKGGSGDDKIRGGEDDDQLYGGSGNDRVIGGSDNDTLEDGTGKDILEGRAGDDLHVLTDDDTTDSVRFFTDDLANGVDTIRGFNASDKSRGGDIVDLRDIGDAHFDVVQLCNQALIFATTENVPEPTLLAVVDNVMAADLLDGNIQIAEGSTIIEANVDLAALIGNALATDGDETETADTATAEIASGVGAASSFDTACTTQSTECLVMTGEEIAIA